MQEDDIYGIKRWGKGYFSINSKGNVVVQPYGDQEGDLYELVKSIVDQGIEAPILIRFNGIIKDRIESLSHSFEKAISEFGYRGSHRMAYPIKVNPQRHVIEIVQQAGKSHSIGLEVGSKPELISVLALEDHYDNILLCNGYKDEEYISLALMAAKLGRETIITIEQPYELKLILKVSNQLGIQANLGFRMKLSYEGSGRWKESGGEHSKFGLFAHEIFACSEQLIAEGKKDWLKLLHYHMGSQIPSIDSIKKALTEGARMYTELAKIHPSLSYFDVGGGLAVDYDGSNSISDSSMNYTEDEYARDVVDAIGSACLNAEVQDPVIITETGRALVAHHSVMITEVIDVTTSTHEIENLDIPKSDNEIISNLMEMATNLNEENCRETFHDVMAIKEKIIESFIQGTLALKERACAEQLVRHLFYKIKIFYDKLSNVPEEIEVLDKILLETYFCNFSVFQSLPDSWAIGQLFPIMPIHRLNQPATHQAILADLSCDSDGKISSFISQEGTTEYLSLNAYRGDPYYLGIFIVGAYQEILGGLHNLFGDTNVVHAELDKNGSWELSRLVEGDTIEEVLHYVQYNTENLKMQLQSLIDYCLKLKMITPSEASVIKKKYKQSLESYTYLVV